MLKHLLQNLVGIQVVGCAAQTEEKYSIIWTSKEEQIFEMPTGGAAKMRLGENLLYFARKEQCLALGTQLRTFKIVDYKIYRIFPNGDLQFLHPKDGVFPEKVNAGRIGSNNKQFSIGKIKSYRCQIHWKKYIR